jgi:hypothetical protein
MCAAAIAGGDTDKAVLSALHGLEHPLSNRWATQLEMVAGVALGLVEEHVRARALLLSSIDRASGMTVPGWLEETLSAVAVYVISTDPRTSSALLSWVRAQTFDKGNPARTPIGYTLYKHGVREVRRVLDDADVQAGKERGGAMSHDEVAACARSALG